MKIFNISATLIGLLFITTANAAIVSGDFRTEGDLPYCCDNSGAIVYENLAVAIGVGAELTGDNLLENPSDWLGGVVHLDLDSTTNILTLDSQDTLDFQIFDAWISNIIFDAGEIITGISLISGNITDLSLLALLSFTDNSIHISYDIGASAIDPNTFDFTGGQAQFQITTSVSTVPIPAAAWLFGSALLGFFGVSRRKAHV